LKFLYFITPRILSFFDLGLIIITAPVYTRTVQGAHNSIPHGIKIIIAAGSLIPLALLLIIALLCFKGGRREYIAAMILSSLMAVSGIAIAGCGGFILIFLDGVESGINPSFDAIYNLSFFLIGGGFLLLGYMIVHVISLFYSAKEIS